ncbi:hypothetical protein CSKR_100680 [Clonorchis sinensis]|uniref:Uncharacterized protein n=1 Tax=Clonorchis sinensis TaxID=79923 RepID=A0A419PG70_CLOSI|nr:hypothetical protein CSKR_100680 [Clonorchis sinensis]
MQLSGLNHGPSSHDQSPTLELTRVPHRDPKRYCFINTFRFSLNEAYQLQNHSVSAALREHDQTTVGSAPKHWDFMATLEAKKATNDLKLGAEKAESPDPIVLQNASNNSGSLGPGTEPIYGRLLCYRLYVKG